MEFQNGYSETSLMQSALQKLEFKYHYGLLRAVLSAKDPLCTPLTSGEESGIISWSTGAMAGLQHVEVTFYLRKDQYIFYVNSVTRPE